MVVTVSANITYACYLNEEKTKKIENYIKEYSTLYGEEISMEEAIFHLLKNDEDFYMYEDSTECDFSTEEILSIEETED